MNFKCANVRDDVINQILYDYEARIVRIPEIEDKSYYEYRKKIIYIESTKQIICPGYILNSRCKTNYNGWEQIVCNPAINTDKTVESTIDGPRAWNYILKILKTKYTDNEIRSILTSYDTKPDYLKQFHYTLTNVSQNVRKLPLCVKYDINGAHTDALCEMFPRCKPNFLHMYEKRHNNEKYKAYPNYFVGMIKHFGYEGAYWWIVDRTTRLLFKAIDYVGGKLIYANTDGFCVQKPERELPTSHNLGDFKEEYKGTVYYYQNNKKSPYFMYQFGKDIKSNCMTEIRQDVDLRKGKVVYYDRVNYGAYYKPENIIKETIKVNG